MQTSFVCKLALFDKQMLFCMLLDVTIPPAEMLTSYKPNEFFDLYERECAQPALSMYGTCVDSSTCWEHGAECLGGTCVCALGKSFNRDKQACVDG